MFLNLLRKRQVEHSKQPRIRSWGYISGLRVKNPSIVALAGCHTIEPETIINLIENQSCVRTYQVTGSLNHDASDLIFDTILPVIQMQTRVIYSFSCSIYWGRNQIIQYHRTLSPNDTFTSLSQIEEYIHQCKLLLLNLDNEGVRSKAYLPAVRITNNPGVYEGHIEFRHIQVWLISSNEPQLGCCPLPDWLWQKEVYLCNQQHG